MGALSAAVQDNEGLAEAGRRLLRWIESGAGSLDELFGLKPERGSRSWRSSLAVEERDDLLRKAARRYAIAPADLCARLRRYYETAWLREQHEASYPTRHEGKVEALLWEVLRLKPDTIGEKRMADILGNEFGDLVSESLMRESLRPRIKEQSGS